MALENSTKSTCEICGAPATRVMDGGDYCRWHDQYTARVTALPCAVCGEPATRVIAGRDMCNMHGEGDEPLPLRRAA